MRKVKIKIDSVSYDDRITQEFEGFTVNEREFEFKDENNKYTIVLEDDSLLYKSDGKSKVDMEFNLEKICNCTYSTVYGDIPMEIRTTVLSIIKGKVIKIVIHYILGIDGDEIFWTKEIKII